MTRDRPIPGCLLCILWLLGCDAFTLDERVPDRRPGADRAASGANSSSIDVQNDAGAGGAAGAEPAEEEEIPTIVAEPAGYGIDVTQGGQIMALDVGGSILPDGDRGLLLVGTARQPAKDGSGLVDGISIQRISPDAQILWSHFFTTGRTITLDGARLDERGYLYIVGGFAGSLTLGSESIDSVVNPGTSIDLEDGRGEPSVDVFFAKLDPDGNLVWLRHFGGVAEQRPYMLPSRDADPLKVVINFKGRFEIDGQTFLSSGGSTEYNGLFTEFDQDGNLVSARQVPDAFGPSIISLDSEGNFIFAGWTSTVYKVDPNLEPLWAAGLDEQAGPRVRRLAVDRQDNIWIAGDGYSGDKNLFGEPIGDEAIVLVKLSPEGDPLLAKTYGAHHLDFAAGLSVLPDNSIAVTGSFYRTVDFGGGEFTALEPSEIAGDVFVARFDENGEHMMSLRAGGIDSDWGYEIAALPDGRLVTSGFFSNAIDFGSGAVTRRGERYHYLAWITP